MIRFFLAFALIASAIAAFVYNAPLQTASAAASTPVPYFNGRSYAPAATATPVPPTTTVWRQGSSIPAVVAATATSADVISINGTYKDGTLGTIELDGYITPGATSADATATASGQINMTRSVVTTESVGGFVTGTTITDVDYTSNFEVGALQSVETYTGTGTTVTSFLQLSASGSTIRIIVPSTGQVYTFSVTLATAMPDDFAQSVEGSFFVLM